MDYSGPVVSDMAAGAEHFRNLPLKDIHLPEPIGLWPFGPGWWLLLCLILLLVGLCWVWRIRKKYRLRRLALARLEKLAETPDDQLVVQLSRLLRQAAICHFSADVAGLTGRAWLEFLDRPFTGRPFSEGEGCCLINAPYHPQPAVDNQALISLCRRWLKTLPASRNEVRGKR